MYMCPVPGICVGFWMPPGMQENLKAHIPPRVSFAAPSLPGVLVRLLFFLSVIFAPGGWGSILSFKAFGGCRPEKTLRQATQRQAPEMIPEEATGQVNTHNHKSLKTRSVFPLLSSESTTGNGNVGWCWLAATVLVSTEWWAGHSVLHQHSAVCGLPKHFLLI